jgi:hypothetical protein
MAPSALYIQEISDLPAITTNPTTKTDFIDLQPNNGSHALIEDALRTRLTHIDDECEDGADAFFVADLGEVRRQHRRWKLNLPRVQPHYGEYTCLCKCYQDADNCSRQVQSRWTSAQAALRYGHWLRLRIESRDRASTLDGH